MVNGHTITEQSSCSASWRLASQPAFASRSATSARARSFRQADQETDPNKVAALRKQGKRLIANGKAMLISATKTRGPTWKALVKR